MHLFFVDKLMRSLRPAPGRLTYLDGWRGLAILFVLVGHDGPFTSQINLGPFGVLLFFVLSGRLMADLLFVRKIALWTFFKRRFARIFPALFVFLTAMLAASSLSLFSQIAHQVDLMQYLSGLFFFSNYWSASGHEVEWMAQIWSLSVEEHCYAIIALISGAVALSRPKAAMIYATIALLCMAWATWCAIQLHQGGHQLYWRTDARAGSVLLSAGIYLLLQKLGGRPIWGVSWLAPIALTLAVIPNFSVLPEWTRYTFSTVLLAVSINFLDRSHLLFRSALSSWPLVLLGLVSYSVYLWQQPFYILHVFYGWGLPATMAGVFGCAVLSFLWVERPAKEYLNHRFGGDRNRTSERTAPSLSAQVAAD